MKRLVNRRAHKRLTRRGVTTVRPHKVLVNGRVTRIGGYKVRPVSAKVLKDYYGTNYYIAKVEGFKNIKPNELVVKRSLPKRLFNETVGHEYTEAELMKRGVKYWPAHLRALRKERSDGV